MDIETAKKQNRRVTIFACILSIVSMGLLIFGFFLVSSDKVVLLQSISNLSNKMNNLLDNNSSLVDRIATSDNIGISSNIGINYDNNNIDLNIDYLENSANKKSRLLSELIINDKELLEADLALANDKLYMFVDDITSNYLYTSLDYISIFSNLESEDYDTLIGLVRSSITDCLDNEDIRKEKTVISYNGKDKKVNKLTYEITNETIKNIITNFVDSLKKDRKLKEKLSDYLNMSALEFENILTDIVESLDYEDNQILYNYVVYYYGFNKIVGYELQEIETNTILEYKIQDKEEINLYSNDIQLLGINISKNKKQSEFNGFIIGSDNNSKITFSGTVINNNTVLVLDLENDIKLKLNIKTTNEEKENSFIYNNNVVLYSVVDSKEEEIMSIDMNSEYSFDEVVNVNLTNSISIDDITEEDISSIYNNILVHPIYDYLSDMLGDYGFELGGQEDI